MTQDAVIRPARRAMLKSLAAMMGLGTILARSSPGGAISKRRLKWIAFYGYTGDEQVLASYDIVVLDPGFAGSISAIAARGARVCAYLSLGEIRKSDPFYDKVEPAALLEANPEWPGTFRIDVRHQTWTKLIIDEMIPAALEKGFTGIMLDTVDTPSYLEQSNPSINRGMSKAAVETIREISARYPDLFLMTKSGLQSAAQHHRLP